MQRYASGDAGAFDRLYARHKDASYRFVRRMVGDPDVAADLHQGVWEKLITSRRRYRPSAKFTTYLYRIARNHVIDHYRSNKPVSTVDPDDLQADAQEPGHELDETAREQALARAIATLPEDQRSALWLQLDQGLSLQQIAEVCGTGRETIKSRLRYAIDKLKRDLNP